MVFSQNGVFTLLSYRLILTDDVPGFVRCDGPLYAGGPVWRIELASAR